ncbi:MAG: hypothetical protein U1F25_08890 [Rubrivivax sp.]
MNRRLAWAVSRGDVAGAVLIALCSCPHLVIAPRVFYASRLAAWWFSIGLTLGAMANPWIHRLCGGQQVPCRGRRCCAWCAERRWRCCSCRSPQGSRRSIRGRQTPRLRVHELAHPAFASAWLQPGFFAARMTAYAAPWWWLARPSSLSSGGRAAAALVLYLLSGTLASVDLLMSLVPGWTSSAFGLVVLSGQALGGSAFAVWRLARNSTRCRAAAGGGAPAAGARPRQPAADVADALGLPRLHGVRSSGPRTQPPEIAWYLPCLNGGWAAGAALALLQFALPLLALLQRRLKDTGVAGPDRCVARP